MAQITPYQRKARVTEAEESGLGKFLQVAGGIAGGVVGGIGGGPAGAIGGATAGAGLGGMIGGAVDPAKPGEVEQPKSFGSVDQPDSAMGRRLAQAKEDRLVTLKKAEAALAQLPKELQEQYASPIVSATMAEEKRRAMGMG